MGATATLGLPYADQDDPPDIGYHTQMLAEETELEILALGIKAAHTQLVSVTMPGATAAGGVVSVPITFPAGRFAVTPHCQATLATAQAGTNLFVPRVAPTSATAASLLVYNVSATATGGSVTFSVAVLATTPVT